MGDNETVVGVSRRSFLKGAAVSGAGVAALGLLGACSPAASESKEPAAVSENGPVDLAGVEKPAQITGDGRYVTKVMGHDDYIYVATELWDGKITSCKVLSQRETIGIGTYACARIPAAIVENQSINVPNVRGCSFTSQAIKAAVKEAIEQSGYDISQFSGEVAEPDVNKDETRDVDVVVVGAGTAGLVCAGKLVELGHNVLVLEKHGIPGGSGTMTYSGLIAADTKAIRAYNFDGSVPEKYASQEANLQNLVAISDPETDRYNGAGPFARTAYPALTEAIDWMADCGVGFMTLGAFEGTYSAGFTNVLSPGMYMGGAGFQAMILAQRIDRHDNGEILYMTKATELIQDGPAGKVTGVKAVGLKSDDSENGYNLTVNAKAVVLATGSYALNPELLKEYEPEFADQSFHCCSASTGDGVVMGLSAGSKIECTGIQFPAYPATTSYFEIAFIDSHKPCVMVNNTGGYIGTADLSHAGMSRALMDESNGGRFFFVLDASAEPTLRYFPMMGYSTYQALYDRGEILYYDTVEAAAEALDLPDLPAYLAENNRAALAGEPNEYGNECEYLETGTGIYLIPTMPAHYLTPSGLCIDPQQHVLTDSYVMDGENAVIEGLYAAGDVTGTISVREGRGYYNGFPLAVGCGYLVAKTIQDELESL